MPTSTPHTIKTVCPYCGVGCGLLLQVKDNQVVKVSGDTTHPANAGRLCTKGMTSAEVLSAPDRLTTAYVRQGRDQPLTPVATEDAIQLGARRLRSIIDQHGPDAVAFYVSGQMSLEAQYLANKLCKGFIGTNNIDSNSRLCMASASSGYKQSLGADGPPGSYQDIEQSQCFLVIGSNMADCHPVLFLRVLDQCRRTGAKLIVVDPRRTTTAEKADLFLQVRPGTDLALLNGLLHLLVKNNRIDPDFIVAHTEGWEELAPFLEEFTPAHVAAITGIAEADIRQAAQWIGDAPEWMTLWTMGLNQSTHGTWHTNAICNLHLATGTICRPGSGPFSLTGQPNAMGGREAGYLSHGLPGQRTVLSEEDRRFTEELWHLPPGTIQPTPGLDAISLFRKLATGDLKAVWIICTNPVASMPNRQEVIDGLQAAKLVITQDAFLETATNRHADIVLPAALWAEAEGVMVNSERNLTLMEQAVDPPGQALADWQLIARVACALGYEAGFSYQSAAEIFAEIRQTWNPQTGYDLRGASYDRLRQEPLQWPCAPEGPARNPIRYQVESKPFVSASFTSLSKIQPQEDPPDFLRFPTASGKARFFARPYLPPAELPDAEYPFLLNTGRLPHQWHTLTKTSKVAALNRLNPAPFIEIHPEDARAHNIGDGDSIAIHSRRGQAVYPATVTDHTQPGVCFTPFHWNDLFGEQQTINAVTNDAVDAISLQPELKCCAVKVRKIVSAEPRSVPIPIVLSTDQKPHATHAVTILFASQTGNAEVIARELAQHLSAAGVSAQLSCMADYPVAALARERLLLIVTSTYGDGDPPDNGLAFWHFLQSAQAPSLSHLHYAVLALGDSSFARFCQHGKNIDARLSALGARALIPQTSCDAGFQTTMTQWVTQITATLLTHPTVRVAPAPMPVTLVLPSPRPVSPVPSAYNKTLPFSAQLVTNLQLNEKSTTKETRHYELSLAGSGLQYAAGDTLGVWPRNCPALVEELLSRLSLSGETLVTVEKVGDLALREALWSHFEIATISREMIHFIAEHSADRQLKSLCTEEHQTELRRFLWGRQLIDLLHDYPHIRLTAQELLPRLKRLQPRLYSIASSPQAHPTEVHLTVRVVRYTCEGRTRKGVASTFLADRAEENRVPVFVQHSSTFHPPADPTVPMIMIGPGSGVAPFRGFLYDRQWSGATGRNWLFFGEHHRDSDFYYQDELRAFQHAGVLTRLDVAFSRDQHEKIYVQHRLLEHGAEVWRWLQEGASVYVCGDASRMAKDVDDALRQVAMRHGGLSEDHAWLYFQQLTTEKRYLRDVY